MTVKERLIRYILYKKLTPYRFEKMCGLSTGYVGNMRVSMQPDKIKNIANIFPDLNTGWLLTGEGGMIRKTDGKNIYTTNISDTKGENNQITQYADTVFHENGTNIATEKQYTTRISEMEKNYKLQLASKDELIKEKDERIKELKLQNEQLNTMIRMLYERK